MSDSGIEPPPSFSIDFGNGQIQQVPLGLLQSSIFPVVVRSDETIRSIGTCFAISSHGLCLTARHVIEEVQLSDDLNGDGDLTLGEEIGIIYLNMELSSEVPSDQIFGGFVPLRTAHFVDGTDIALLHFNFPVHVETGENPPIPRQPLRLTPPEAGDRILAFGYDQGVWTKTPGAVELQHNFKATQGFVGEVFERRRDGAMLNFPCFENSAAFLSGMSGGPVISETGRVVGVISSGFELGEDESPISYAASLAPAMFLSLQAIDDEGSVRPLYLWDFAASGTIAVDQGTAIVERTDRGLSIRVGNITFQSHT